MMINYVSHGLWNIKNHIIKPKQVNTLLGFWVTKGKIHYLVF